MHGVSISPDGKRVLTASCDFSAVLWDVATERPLQTYPHAGEAHAVAFSPDGKTFISGCSPVGDDKIGLRLYDATTGKPIEEFPIEAVDQMSYLDGGKRAVVLGGFEVSMLDVQGRKLTRLDTGEAAIHAISASEDGKRFLIGGTFETDLAEFNPNKRTILNYGGTTTDVVRVTAISPDGTWGLIAGGGKNQPWGDYQKHYEPAKDCDVRIVTLSRGFNPAIYTRNDPRLAESTGCVVGSADGRRVLTFNRDGAIVWWDSDRGQELARIKWEHSATLTAMSPDGKVSAVLDTDGRVTIYEVGKVTGHVRDESDHEVLSMALAPDGKSIFVAGWRRANPAAKGAAAATEAAVHWYSVADGKELRTFNGPVGAVSGLALSPDGRIVVALWSSRYGGETAALAWDAASGRELWRWTPATKPPKSLLGPISIDSQGKSTAFAFDKSVLILDLQNGHVLAQLDGYTAPVKQLAFDPDGKRIWTVASWDVRSWDRLTGEQLVQIQQPMKTVNWLMRFADGRHQLIEAMGKKLIEHDLDP